MSSEEETKQVADTNEEPDSETKEENFPKPEAPAPKAKPVRVRFIFNAVSKVVLSLSDMSDFISL